MRTHSPDSWPTVRRPGTRTGLLSRIRSTCRIGFCRRSGVPVRSTNASIRASCTRVEAPVCVTVGGSTSTVKWISALLPVGLPTELRCVAIAVYVPSTSDTPLAISEGEDQTPPDTSATTEATGDSVSVAPAYTSTVTSSCGSLAVPLNSGAVSLVGVSIWFNDTTGVMVITSKCIGSLLPGGLPIELGWLATAVYFPLLSALERAGAVQRPLLPAP